LAFGEEETVLMNGTPDPMEPRKDDIFARARAGDEAAWAELVDLCYDKVRRVVRRRLGGPMRTLYDSTDFANDVFKSLVAKSEWFDFPSLEALKAHLVRAAKQKVIDEYRRQHRQRRDIDRQFRFGEMEGGEWGGAYEPPGHDPTPSQHAQAVETRERILADHSGADREVLDLKAQGFGNEEAAEQTGLHLRKVQRLVKKVSDSWFMRGGGR
jgi:RNA polymerase sigma-70 factor (ECF subfamily)